MNKQNEILKHKYLQYLHHVKGRADETILKHEQAIHYYETCFHNEDFGMFNSEKAITFKEYLITREFAGNSIKTILNSFKQYLIWLKNKDVYKRKINFDDIEYLNTLKRDNRLANKKIPREYPKLDHILTLVNSIDDKTDVGMRNKALISFAACTGMRDRAIMTIPLSAVNLSTLTVAQYPDLGVETKFSDSISSIIFRFHPDLVDAITKWMEKLVDLKFQDRHPFFPKSRSNNSSNDRTYLQATEVDKYFYKSTVSIRAIFKKASIEANLKYFIPHSFRDFAIITAVKSAKNGLELKAISQNFGHKEVLTTFLYYGILPPNELIEILSSMSFSENRISTDEKIDQIYNWYKEMRNQS